MIIAATAVNFWLFLDTGASREWIILALGIELLVLLGSVWTLAAFFELRIFRPLRQLRDHLGVFLHSDSDHRVDIGSSHRLGDLPDYVEELSHQLARERRETARVMNAAAERIEHRKSRLEAILRDLHEGVVVCNGDHRIVLFNQSAAMLLESAGPIGLHRPIVSVLNAEKTMNEFARLRRQYESNPGHALLSRFVDRTVDGRDIEIRMSLIIEQGRTCSGYVLSFSRGGDTDKAPAHPILSDRPEFYDFSLFEARYDAGILDRGLNRLDYVVFDTETTGLNPSRGDEIVQISGVRLVNGVPTGEEFDTLVNPGMPIPPASIRFHGITDDMVTDAPSVSEAVRSFKTFVEGAVLVAHNAAFDMKFLRLRESSSGVMFDNPVLDTLLISVVLQPNHTAHTLDAIAARFGVSIADDARHTALGDARATAEVFIKMLPVLSRNGMDTLGRVLDASSKMFDMRRQQERL